MSDRSEDLLAEQLVAGIGGFDQRRADEVALAAVGLAAGDDLRVAAAVLDVLADLVERALVDDRAHEVAEVGRVAHLDLVDHRRPRDRARAFQIDFGT